MTEYFVDPIYGDDSGAGTESDPWQTLEWAIDHMDDGDKAWLKASGDYTVEAEGMSCILYIDPGITYQHPLGTTADPVVFEGYYETIGDNGIATFDAGPNTLDYCVRFAAHGSNVSNIVFKNIEFTGAAVNNFLNNGFGGYTINCRFTNSVLGCQNDRQHRAIGCQYDNNTTYGISEDPDGNAYYCTFVACVFKENNYDGADQEPDAKFLDCVFYNNQKTGGNANAYVNGATYAAMCYGCTFDGYGNTDSVGFDNTTSGPGYHTIIVNNIFFDLGLGTRTDSACKTAIVAYNLYSLNDTDSSGYPDPDDQDGSISTTIDPFTNSAINDYSLTSDSEAKAAGIDGRWTQEFWESFEDSTNPPSGMNSYKDIGAWQRQEPVGGGGGRRTRIKEHGI